MERYKSWSDLNRRLRDGLCDELRERVTFFLTRYHAVHNAYGRAAILVDGRERAAFSWVEAYRQDHQLGQLSDARSWAEAREQLAPEWDAACTYSDMDFLDAVLRFRSLSIQDALRAENGIVRSLAILDRRVGKRTLARLQAEGAYRQYPQWVRQFYELRFSLCLKPHGQSAAEDGSMESASEV